MWRIESNLLQGVRAIAKQPCLATSATAYKGTTLHKHRAIGHNDAHLTTYAQWSTLYYSHLYLWHDVYYTLFHNFFFNKT